jgi:pilus assembly protein FimV
MRTTPRRVAIHAKLLEIYAKRRDVKAFEAVATDAFNLTHGEGHEWAHIRAMGAELDHANPMYEPGERPPAVNRVSHENDKPIDLPALSPSTISPIIEPPSQPPLESVDFDLDVTFLTADQPPQAASPTSPVLPTVAASAAHSEHSPVINTPLLPSLEMTLDNNFDEQPAVTAPPQASSGANPLPALHATTALDKGMLEFDLDSLSLDLDTPAAESPTTPLMPLDDPLEIKLALAQEFSAVGDHDGARSLADEVVAQAEGPLKLKAQTFLRDLA